MNRVMELVLSWIQAEMMPVPEEGYMEKLSDDERERCLGLEKVMNARQLGGYRMKDGRTVKKDVLLRTATLYYATDRDVELLKEKYHVKLILDLRSSTERKRFPDREITGAEMIWESLMEGALDGFGSGEEAERKLLAVLGTPPDYSRLTIGMLSDPAKRQFFRDEYPSMMASKTTGNGIADSIRKILSLEGGTVLWHCTQGKDRCGLLAVMILAALGADDELILRDFEETNRYYEPVIRERMALLTAIGADMEMKEAMEAFLGVRRDYMENAIRSLNETYGSLEGYLLKEVGLSEEELNRFKDLYLE